MAAGFKVTDVLNKNSKAGLDESPRAKSRTKDISIHKIYPNKLNFYPQNEIEEKAGEILAVGLIEPLAVMFKPCEKGEYGIISGERRWRGLHLLVEQGYKEFEIVTCQIRTPENEWEERIEIILANSHRQNDIATVLQEEKELKETLGHMKDNNLQIKGYDLQKGRLRDIIAKILNTSRTKVAQIENINKNLIPEFQEELKKERLTFSAASEIAGMAEEKQQEVYGQYAETGSITHKEVKEIKALDESEEAEGIQEESQEDVTQKEQPKQVESEGQQEENFNPCPDTLTTRCYSCENWDRCDKRDATVTYCKDFKDRDKPNTLSDREEEAKANSFKQTSTSQPIMEQPKEEPPTPIPQRIHDIKLAHMFYEDELSGIKPFTLRKNDRDYKVGDILHNMEYNDGEYTGNSFKALITSMLQDYKGLTDDYCILGIKAVS